MSTAEVIIRDAPVAAIEPSTLYRVLALRVDVFVVEQACVYRELDGRDLEASARLVWAEQDGAVLATLRLLVEADGTARIGRVATAVSARGQGLAARLMTRTLELCAGREVVLDAQANLAGWYARFEFERHGADFVEDGIAHTPMRRPAS
jgi:ElaA protein